MTRGLAGLARCAQCLQSISSTVTAVGEHQSRGAGRGLAACVPRLAKGLNQAAPPAAGPPYACCGASRVSRGRLITERITWKLKHTHTNTHTQCPRPRAHTHNYEEPTRHLRETKSDLFSNPRNSEFTARSYLTSKEVGLCSTEASLSRSAVGPGGAHAHTHTGPKCIRDKGEAICHPGDVKVSLRWRGGASRASPRGQAKQPQAAQVEMHCTPRWKCRAPR